jgi:Membrane carboxypeptidase/penicillin-binding protein
MTNVHGISVAGGTFPATIWRLFMEKALENEPTRDFPLPNTYPTYKDWHGEWQYSGGSYVPTPNYSAPVTPTTTATTATTEQASAGEAQEGEEEDIAAASSPTAA